MGSAHFSVKNEPSERTVYLHMEGFFEESEMREFIQLFLAATASYAGQAHLVLADMRGMQVASLEVSKILGEAIGEARKKGVTCCVHLTSSTVQKMQAARLAREHTQGEDVTVNVTTLEDAQRVLEEARLWQGLSAPGGGSKAST